MRIDVDNLCKFTLDALNGHVYTDDRFIVELSCLKRYGDDDCTIIEINMIEEFEVVDPRLSTSILREVPLHNVASENIEIVNGQVIHIID